MSNMNKYDDIIGLPHHTSQNHPQMAMIDRAAQFSPFAALTGHGAAIAETARLTDERIELDESRKEFINESLKIISDSFGLIEEVTVMFFLPDETKTGGSYHSVTGKIKKINAYNREIIMRDGSVIPVENIYDIAFEIGTAAY